MPSQVIMQHSPEGLKDFKNLPNKGSDERKKPWKVAAILVSSALIPARLCLHVLVISDVDVHLWSHRPSLLNDNLPSVNNF